MFEIFGAFLISFVLVVIKMPAIVDYCDWFQLYDTSDFHRKYHEFDTPRLGGVAVFSTFMLSMLLFLNIQEHAFGSLLFASSTIFFIGLKDDILGEVSPMEKVCAQVLSALVLVLFGGYTITNMYGLFGVFVLGEWVGIILSIIIIIFVVNAFNFIDGIDGLAGATGVFVNVSFGVLFFRLGNLEMTFVSFTTAGAIAGFLRYNFVPGTIFLGDSGSMLIGLISVCSAIKFSTQHAPHTSDPTFVDLSPSISVAILIIPVFDGIRVFLLRILGGKSPFIGDRNHVHHKLKELGFSDARIVGIFLCFNVWLLILTLFLNFLGNTEMICILFGICIVLNVWIAYEKGKRY